MKNKYFDKELFTDIHNLVNINPYSAICKMEQYLEKYPDDYSAYIDYALALCTIEKYDEAEHAINFVESIKDKWININETKTRIMKENIIHAHIKIFAGREEYQKLYDYYYSNLNNIKTMNYNNIIFYCEKKLGINKPALNQHKSYLFRQIDNYQELEFISHIQNHLPNYNSTNTSIFSDDFKLIKTLSEIKKYIPSKNRLFSGLYEDTYIFKYDNCGTDHEEKVDYFKVICFHNTSDIITMCPASNCEKLPYTDINIIAYGDNIKKESRIDKFNKRYGL